MVGSDELLAVVEFVWRELALFAGSGFLLLGASDLAIDLIWIGRTLWRRMTVYRRFDRARADIFPRPEQPGLLVIFIPAWDEAVVIGHMLRHALATLDHGDYRIYVGCYPNDPATIAAVRTVDDSRIRLVVTQSDGGTTKADCLNSIWQALLADEALEGRPAKGVVLHDAEDVVHSSELRIFDRLIERFDLIQLPVLPLIDRNSRWVAGHYADEFAEAHGKELVVREALGASMPSAGVGCAFSRDSLEALAIGRAGPFDAECLTEDYELGLRLRAAGRRGIFVRMRSGPDRPLVVTREYFPSTIAAAVSQKARWTIGIALSGWDRMGWTGGIAEYWMRLRDRQSVLAAIVIAAGYASLLLFALHWLMLFFVDYPIEPISRELWLLLAVNAWLVVWRLAMRFGFVTAGYGWREGFRSIPRVLVSNFISMLAARRAVIGYLRIRRSGQTRWDKTAHAFPAFAPAE